jgi:hypothetical protein
MKCAILSARDNPGRDDNGYLRTGRDDPCGKKEGPARLCTNCGEDYVDEQVAREIMALARRMA